MFAINIRCFLGEIAMKKLIFILALLFTIPSTIWAQGNAFSFQGRLNDGTNPANGAYDLEFRLYPTITGGTQIATVVSRPNTALINGVFSVMLDFGPTAFNNPNSVFIEIAVRPNGSPNAYTILGPRQQLSVVPYAIKANNAASADALSCVSCISDGHIISVDAVKVTGVLSATNGGTGIGPNLPPPDTYLKSNGSGWTAAGLSGDGSGLTNLNGANITNNTINPSALAADTFPNSRNLSLLGSLRWDLLGQRVGVGATPYGIAFDGANIWVANSGSNNVTKIRVSDGAVQGTFPVGANPQAVTSDGENIWVANYSSHTLTKLRKSDGVLLGTFSAGFNPVRVAFDGANIWVTNSSNVAKLRASDGAIQGAFPVGQGPRALAFDGANIWVANSLSNTVTKLRASDGACVNPCTFSVGTNPSGITFDGANIWVANSTSNNVTKLRADNGVCYGVCVFPTGIDSNPTGVLFDGKNIWLTGPFGIILKLRTSDGVIEGAYPVSNAAGFAFDGASIWVTNYISDVIRLPVFN